MPVANSALRYVELKFRLGATMNHSFDNMSAIVCWDTDIKHGDRATDVGGTERLLHIAPADPAAGGYAGYFLRRDFKPDIEVFVLRSYLKERLGIDFFPRTAPPMASVSIAVVA